jgi:hypothetical protein
MKFGTFLGQNSRAAITLLAILMCAGVASAQQNLVYIDANISATGQNAVVVLVNDGTGNLTPLAGSPFPTGGTGIVGTGSGNQLDNDGEVVINPEATLLFAVNGNSDNISVFHIDRNGSLAPVAGSPFASNGIEPASLAFADNVFGQGSSRLVVVNQATDPSQSDNVPNYATFSVSPQGSLTAGSSYALPAGTAPAQAIIRPGMAQFFGIEFMNKTVSSYKFTPKGTITQISSVTPAGPVPVVVGGVKNPLANGLYVGLPADLNIAVLSYNAAGTLATGPEVATIGMAPCWLTINTAGTVLYDSETPSGAITVWNVTNSHKPIQLQHLAVRGTGALPAHMRIDPTGQFLYVLDRTGVLHVMNINSDGTVAENLTPYDLGLPSGTVPLGLAVLMK